MDLKWSYYLIGALFVITILLKYLNKKEEEQFKNIYQEVTCYKGYKKDFFRAIGRACAVIGLAINITSFFARGVVVPSSIVVTISIVLLWLVARKINIIVTQDGHMLIDGTLIKKEEIKEVTTKKTKHCTWYELEFTKTINGYTGVTFSLEDKQDQFEVYIQ